MVFNSRRSTVMARKGMVATSQPLASMAGLRMMMEGGNAIDAAVASAAVLNVVEPASTGVGGDVFALVWMAKDKKVVALNASGRSGAASSADELTSQGLTAISSDSAYSVTVPGAVSGWDEIVSRFGKMPLSRVLEPAIEYASVGFPVSEIISGQWANNAHKLQRFPSGGELLKDGRAPRAGEVMKMPELAETMRTIAEGGAEAFYKGRLGERIAAYVRERGGWLTAEDMASHLPTLEEPISTEYRGVTVWQCPPNSQGVNTLMALNLVEGFDVKHMGFQTADTYHHLIESVRLALTDGMHHVTDPARMNVATEDLISKAYAEERRKLIRPDSVMDPAPVGWPQPKCDTVYLTCVDGEGNACSFINSVYMGFGCGLVVPGTGIVLHSRGASFSLDAERPNFLEPNKRPFHTLIPGMATKQGELWLSYGVMGTVQQAQGQMQVLVNMIDFGLSPQAAVDAPRFSVRLGEGIGIEDIVPEAVIGDLRARGHELVVREPHPLFFGGGQIIERDAETGVLKAGSEPRNDGFAVGW